MRIGTSIALVASTIGLLGISNVAAGAVNMWAVQAVQGGATPTSDEAVGYAVTPLADGSSLIAGFFETSATFGGTTLTSASPGVDEAFVAKLNADGSWAWATRAAQAAGATAGDSIRAISALPDGSAIVAGSFGGTTTFGSTTLINPGSQDNVFVAKISAGGEWVWATRVADAGSQPDVGRGVTALPDGSAIISGYVRGNPVFTPFTLNTTRRDAFVAKIAADGSSWEWATLAGGSGDDEAFGVSALPDGSAVVAGRFAGSASFGGVTLASAGGTDAYMAKIGSGGAWQWATRAGGAAADGAYAVSAFSDGSAVSAGYFTGTADFGSISLATTAGGAFVGRTTPTGEWQWATKAEDSVAATGVAIAGRHDGGAMFAGSIQGTAAFGGTTLTATGSRDAVVAQISPSGAWDWAQQAGDGTFAEGRGIAIFPDRSFVMTGDFSSTLRFGASALTTSGSRDVFATRFAEETVQPAAASAVVTPLPTSFRVVRTSVLRTSVTRRAVAIRTSVRVDGPGVIRQSGTRPHRLRAGKRVVACTTKPRVAPRITTAVVTCVLNRRTRAALRAGSVSVRLVTRFTANGEAAQVKTMTVRVPRGPSRRVPVTG